MAYLLEAGPFSARDSQGKLLFEKAELRLAEATAVILEGPSGSGKSTLLRHLAAIDASPTAVRRVAGKAIDGKSLPVWRARVTLMAQDAPMLPDTVRANLEFPYRFRHARRPGPGTDEVAGLMRRVGMADLPLDRDVIRLSGGERHRLGLVRALLWDPPVLLADEPLAGLDPDTADDCFELLLSFARRPGHALLATLHDPRLAPRTDGSIRLQEGRLELVA
jgi:ABC-type iron transport system FetAB ATPase subunit